jgi:hypothetical protein
MTDAPAPPSHLHKHTHARCGAGLMGGGERGDGIRSSAPISLTSLMPGSGALKGYVCMRACVYVCACVCVCVFVCKYVYVYIRL